MARPRIPTSYEDRLHDQIGLLRTFLRMAQAYAPPDLGEAIDSVLARTAEPLDSVLIQRQHNAAH